MNPESCRPLPLSRIEAIDINTPEDFRLAEIVWRGLQQAEDEARAEASCETGRLPKRERAA
jgi:hypothetical protein